MPTGAVEPKIFVSYRRSDTSGQARLLHNELATRFAPENVFIDVKVEPGTNFMKVINERVAVPGVLIALIGPQWSTIVRERIRRGQLDIVRIEIEAALKRGSRLRVVPVLVDDAEMPSSDKLPRPLKPLAAIMAAALRHTRWDDDMKHLIERIDLLMREIGNPPAPPPPPPPAPPQATTQVEVAPPPDRSHYEDMAGLIVSEGAVVPVLGPGVNAGDRDDRWQDGCGYLPDAEELALHLARRFNKT